MTDLKDKQGLQLTNVIDLALERFAEQLHTAIPGKIESVENFPKLTIKPLVRTNDRQSYESLPILLNVPMIRQISSGTSARALFPVEVGDTGLIIFFENSIDNFLDSNGENIVDPDGVRRHDLSDAVFIPGLIPFGKTVENYNNDTVQIIADTHDMTIGTNADATLAAENLLIAANDTLTALAATIKIGDGFTPEQPATRWTNLDIILTTVFGAIDTAIIGLGGAGVALSAYNTGKTTTPPNSSITKLQG